jgi:hypothetical protein
MAQVQAREADQVPHVPHVVLHKCVCGGVVCVCLFVYVFVYVGAEVLVCA